MRDLISPAFQLDPLEGQKMFHHEINGLAIVSCFRFVSINLIGILQSLAEWKLPFIKGCGYVWSMRQVYLSN